MRGGAAFSEEGWNMQAESLAIVRRPSFARSAASLARSALSNGNRLLDGIDGRSASARRFRDLIHDLTKEHVGKDAPLTTGEHNLVRQAAALVLRAEQLQSRLVRGEPVDEDLLIRLSSEGRRILANLARRRERKQRDPGLELRASPFRDTP
jgi:hypothetical protein